MRSYRLTVEVDIFRITASKATYMSVNTVGILNIATFFFFKGKLKLKGTQSGVIKRKKKKLSHFFFEKKSGAFGKESPLIFF